MKETYTREEVIELLVKERTRAKDICYEVYQEQEISAKNFKNAGNDLQFVIRGEVSDKARQLGNAISGGNALSAALGETMRDRIEEQLNKQP